MDYSERLENVAVLGAAGKMGSGIVLLVAMEMADLALKPENRSRRYVLHAVDVSHEALGGLMKYLREQVLKAAEKKIVALRKVYADRADLVENGDIVRQYVNDVLDVVRPTTTLEAAAEANIIFEAAPEDLDAEAEALRPDRHRQPARARGSSPTPRRFPSRRSTRRRSSAAAIMGFHFYNPPAVQRLVELIRSRTTTDEVAAFAEALCKNLRKTVVPSADRAGLHRQRALHARPAARDRPRSSASAPTCRSSRPSTRVNRVSQDFLVRPMGIFQLTDYVGLDVCQCILGVMNPRTDRRRTSTARSSTACSRRGVRGGQHHDGSQKDGFLQYQQGKPVGVYDPDGKRYVPIAELPGGVRRAARAAARAGAAVEGGGARPGEGREARGVLRPAEVDGDAGRRAGAPLRRAIARHRAEARERRRGAQRERRQHRCC